MAFFGREARFQVLGPVFYYDMVRQARRGKFLLVRLAYLLVLLYFLFAETGLAFRINAREAPHFAESYFNLFMLVQFITLTLLTPAYVAGAIAEERERKTLEFMLATDLRNREIVLSKFGSRLGNLTLLLLTGLPILSILQFLGGIDPNLILAGYAITGMAMFGLASMSILCSVICRKALHAVILAYVVLALYSALGLLAPYAAAILPAAVSGFLQSSLEVYNAGSLVQVLYEMRSAGASGTLATVLPTLIWQFAGFHFWVALACLTLSVCLVRRLALKPARLWAATASDIGIKSPRSEIGLDAMLWKELWCGHRKRSLGFYLGVGGLLVILNVLPVAVLTWGNLATSNFSVRFLYPTLLAQNMNAWVRCLTCVVGCLTVLAITAKASLSITKEHENLTLESLLTLPLNSSAILHAKWLGSIFRMRLGLGFLATLWLVGLLTGGLHFAALILLNACFFVYATFGATLGLLFSTMCRSSQRSLVMSLLVLFVMSAFPLYLSRLDNDPISQVQFSVLSPPCAMWFLAFGPVDIGPEGHYWRDVGVTPVLGWILWSVATFVLYCMAKARFAALTRCDAFLTVESRGPQSDLPMSPWFPPPVR